MGKLPGTHPCIGTGHPRPETFLQSKTFPRTCCRTAGPSTALRSGRDDKGERGRFHGMFPTEWVAQVSILRPGYLRADLSYRNTQVSKSRPGPPTLVLQRNRSWDLCSAKKQELGTHLQVRFRDQQQGIERRDADLWIVMQQLVVGINSSRHGDGGKPIGLGCCDIRGCVADDT
jgi:hypothetical protein